MDLNIDSSSGEFGNMKSVGVELLNKIKVTYIEMKQKESFNNKYNQP